MDGNITGTAKRTMAYGLGSGLEETLSQLNINEVKTLTVFFQVHHSLEFHVIPGPWNANSCLRQSSSLTVTRHPLCGSSIQSATQQSPSLPRQRVPLASAPIPKQRGRKLAAGANGPLGAGKWVGVRPPSCPGQAQRAWVEGEAGEPAGLRNPWGA